MVDFLAILGLFTLILGAALGFAGLYALVQHRKNGALFLGTLLILVALAILYLASKMNAMV